MKIRDVLDAVEEQGEINAGKGKKKYIRHITPEQAEQEIRGMIEGMKRDIGKECPQPYSVGYEYRIPEIRGYNQALADITEKLFGEGEIKEEND